MWRYERGRGPSSCPQGACKPPRGLQILWLIVVQESWSAVQEGAGQCTAVQGRACTCQNHFAPQHYL